MRGEAKFIRPKLDDTKIVAPPPVSKRLRLLLKAAKNPV